MRRLLALGSLLVVLAVTGVVGDASGSCPPWPNWKPSYEQYTAQQYITAIIQRADIELANPNCDDACRLNWVAARELAMWSTAHGNTCGNPLFHTCGDYYYHVKFAYRKSFNGDPVGCFNELDHQD